MKIRYELGDEVYLKTDEEQRIRMVTGIKISNGGVVYYLNQGINESCHYDIEISIEKNKLMCL